MKDSIARGGRFLNNTFSEKPQTLFMAKEAIEVTEVRLKLF